MGGFLLLVPLPKKKRNIGTSQLMSKIEMSWASRHHHQMRKVILFSAASLDGFIARKSGSIDWLPQPEDGQDCGFSEFFKTVTVTLSGSNTFAQALDFPDFPYLTKQNIVFSRNKTKFDEVIKDRALPAMVIDTDPVAFVRSLKHSSDDDPGHIWLIGGGKLNTTLLNAKLIDELILTYIPVILGQGIPLFDSFESSSNCLETPLHLENVTKFNNGIIQMHYTIQQEDQVEHSHPIPPP